MAFPIYQAQSLPKVRKLFCVIRNLVRPVSVLEPKEIVFNRCGKGDLILEVRQVEHRRVRHISPAQ